MSNDVLCDRKHADPSPMDVLVNAPYTDEVKDEIHTTWKCSTGGCERRFNMRFGYFTMREKIVDTSDAPRKICKLTQRCNDEIVFLALVDGERWYCFSCHQYEASETVA